MAILKFEQIGADDVNVGGKAWGLARLHQQNFPVPSGMVVTGGLVDGDWDKIVDWWAALGRRPLAVRSSGGAEDSKTTSFAGQNKSFLNIDTEPSLRKAIDDCFASAQRDASLAYRQFFSEAAGKAAPGMNVVLQEMVTPKFSGVFFSRDPRDRQGQWLLEVVPGLGEDLVSGKVTPGKVFADGKYENLAQGFSLEKARDVAETGLKIAERMHYDADVEWAIDSNDRLFVLQTRPITTDADSRNAMIDAELQRLLAKYPAETAWDGQTFAEWSGFPSYFTFSIWKNAFSPHHAFGNALRQLGYESFSDAPYSPKDSLLERVFGRAFINMDRLSDLYYGPIPYRIKLNPRPQTVFDWRKLNWTVFKHTPQALKSMIRVSWNLSSNRKTWLDMCSAELNRFGLVASAPLSQEKYKDYSPAELKGIVASESWRFSKEYLHWPLVLVILMESTVQRLNILMKSVLGAEKASKTVRDWMGRGLHTVTASMREEYQQALENPGKRDEFLAKFGHRGPGEMDLANPRWIELGAAAFRGGKLKNLNRTPAELSVEMEIAKLNTYKQAVILEEWNLLKRMVELRELWKMELLKPYAGIRFALNELGTRLGIGQAIHWLRLSEIESLTNGLSPEIEKSVASRKQRFAAFREYYFPPLVTLAKIRGIVNGESPAVNSHSLEGEPLSSGVVHGVVRVVTDASQTDTDSWPENTILVAESTDPGWTPLFVKARAIIVQNGGVLSHSAIVAREMGIPAVGGIKGCHKMFKDGDLLWVDGNLGRVLHES
jgi:phosphohistidine swiveling domain-containing protein